MTDEKKPWETSTGETPAWMGGRGLDSDMTREASGKKSSTLRFWMKKGEERNVVFVTDSNTSPLVHEHQVRLGGSWQNHFTCLEPLGIPCPLCKWANENDGQYRRYKAQFFTIIDLTEFTDRSGKVRKNERRLLVAKKDTTEILKRKYLARLEADQSLKGAKFKIYRTNSDKSAAVGTDYEFIGMTRLEEYPEHGEFDFAEVLKPNPEAVEAAVRRLASEAGVEAGVGAEEGTDTKVSY